MADTRSRNRSRGTKTVAVLGLATLGLVTGCSGSSDAGPSDENVELTMWFGREDFIPDDAFDAFHEEYPNIEVTADVIPLEEATSTFMRQYDAGSAPDLFQIEYEYAGLLARRDMLLDLADIQTTWEEEDPELYDNMIDAGWEMGTWDDTVYGLALHLGPYLHTYRTDVLEEAGAEVPTTWEEVLEASRAIVEETDSYGWGTNGSRENKPAWEISIFAQMGGQWEDNVMQIDSEAGHYWLSFYQTLISEGLAHPDTIAWNSGDMRAAFMDGSSAQVMEALNVYPEFQTVIENGSEWDVSVSPIAREGAEEESRYVGNGWPYYVNSQTEHPYEAGLVLRYLADFDQSLSVATRYQPTANIEVMESDEYLEANPYAEELLSTWSEVEQAPAHLMQAQMNEVIRDAVQWALANPDGDVAEAAQGFQEELDSLAAEVSE
ncbi:extracellular solute-binding protein [Nesterenkonia sp. AY15]|uniref:ABC transporter substrate-binding protein n=1 Tax=Nesterenkonia sp. AY15 TaxID=2901139 RepID=UPI001F4C99DD|nr:extracellular solute-binding protein [Nesterenkonia sp. AY15]MCH8572219.1 extracellular solute-binding protein [Nesterenkonia sp. AY15]